MANTNSRIRLFALIALGLADTQSPAQSVYEPYTFTTIAGSAGYGAVDGMGRAAQFHSPRGLAVDKGGNIYVADTLNHTIRKVTPAGTVTTLAGLANVSGSGDGVGSGARFNHPEGVAVDSDGNIYVADTFNATIRKVTSAGEVMTIAGRAKPDVFGPQVGESADGTGTEARFNHPSGIAVDSARNLYLTDSADHTVRKVTSSGVVSTLAGLAGTSGSTDGAGSDARFFRPAGLGVDAAGTVYVADSGNNTIRKVTSAGLVTTLAGLAGSSGTVDGSGADALFNNPSALTVDSVGNLYTTDWNVIRKITATGIVTTSAELNDASGADAPFTMASGLAVDGPGNIYVADSDNSIIRKVTPTGAITTLAGRLGSFGSTDATGSAARFWAPEGLAVDPTGNIYVADSGNSLIRKVAVTRAVTTLAGQNTEDTDPDGSGIVAEFGETRGIAADSTGNLYVADAGSHTIRKVTPEGVVTTLAGLRGTPGYADGSGTAARFSEPSGLAVDAADNLYVADAGNNTIRKVTSAAVVTTIAGNAAVEDSFGPPIRGSADGVGNDARFWGPSGVAVDGAGAIYVADTFNHSLRKITPQGEVTTFAGLASVSGSADGTRSEARFNGPDGLAVDAAGNLYVADSGNHTIRKVTPAGVVTTLAGLAGQDGSADGVGADARFSYPHGVTVNAAGTVFVADANNSILRQVTSAGVVTTLAGQARCSGTADGVGSDARFRFPKGVALAGGDALYVADEGSDTIRKVTPAGDVTTVAGHPRLYSAPAGTAVDSLGNIYVADSGYNVIRKVSAQGVVTTLAGLVGSVGSMDGSASAARFNYPHGLAVDRAGNVYVADSGNNLIRKVSPLGVVTTVAGLPCQQGSTDGAGSDARFLGPSGAAVDSEGNVYVADSGNSTIRKISATGVVRTLAGLAGTIGVADGTGSEARFWGPSALAVDDTGNVYVADTANSTVRKVTPAGVVTTLAGTPRSYAYMDGTGFDARFNNPNGVAVDAGGNLYVSDFGNYTLRKVTPTGEVTTLAGLPSSGGRTVDGTGNAARFGQLMGVALDPGGTIYVSQFDGAVRKVTPAGEVTTVASLAAIPNPDGTGPDARFRFPSGIAMDVSGNLFAADSNNHTIRKITPRGVVTTLAGLTGNYGSADGMGTDSRFWGPSSVAVDLAGCIYVADAGNNTIRKLTPGGMVTTLAGLAPIGGSADGTGSAARFNRPYGLAVDRAGNVYVADTFNSTIRSVTPAGVVTTLAGLAGNHGAADGTGSEARFYEPSGVAVDSTGAIYVADTRNNTIRKVTPTGVVTTLAGAVIDISNIDLGIRPPLGGYANGTGSAARFNQPWGVAVDAAGNLYVADSLNNTIRKGSPALTIAFSRPTAVFTGGQFGFSFMFTGSATPPVLVESSTDLRSWWPVWTNNTSGDLRFTDLQSGVSSNRFYRARLP